jgi:hypothetical protein
MTQERSAKTDCEYAGRAQQLLSRARDKFPTAPDSLSAFTMLCSEPDWKLRPSSTRSYKAAMVAKIEQDVEAGLLEPESALEEIVKISGLLAKRRGRPEARTSAKKCIDFTEDEFLLIIDDLRLRSSDRLDTALRLFMEVSARLGLRQSEFKRAVLTGRTLVIMNGKHSNGRAPGRTRSISLERMPERLLRATEHLLKEIKLLVARYGSVERLCGILSERLARVCKRLGFVRFCLYSCRHLAIATWKRAGFSAVEIAALAGHISTATAWRHYAGAKHGWRPGAVCVQPDKAVISLIQDYMRSGPKEPLPPPWEPPASWNLGSSPVMRI